MAFFDEKIIEMYSNLEEVRNIQLKKYNFELEEICKMSEEERIDKMDKMRILLKLKKLYEELDVRVIQGEMIFYKGKAVVSQKQLEEIKKLSDKCLEEEMNYSKIIEEEKFILTDDIRKQLNDYIECRESILQGYITNSINAAIPGLNPTSAFFMSQKEYIELIFMLSELNIVIQGQEVYVNEKSIQKKGEYFGLAKEISKINQIAIQFFEKLK